jgi:hypothetical protein
LCASTKPSETRYGGNAPRTGWAIPGQRDNWHLWEFKRRSQYVTDAWDLCMRRFAEKAIHRYVGKGFYDVVKSVFPPLFPALGGFIATTIVSALVGLSLGALCGGIGAAPATIIGAKIGMAIGMWILGWMGVGFLLMFLSDRVGELGVLLKSGVLRAWNSAGSDKEIELAARDLAEMLGLFYSLLLQGLVQYLVKAADDGRVTEAMQQLRNSRLFRICEKLEKWLLKNYPRLREKYVPFFWRIIAQAPLTGGNQRPAWLRMKVGPREYYLDIGDNSGDDSKEAQALQHGAPSGPPNDNFPIDAVAGLLDYVEGQLAFQPRKKYYMQGQELKGWRIAVDTSGKVWQVSQLFIPAGARQGGRWVVHVESGKRAGERL